MKTNLGVADLGDLFNDNLKKGDEEYEIWRYTWRRIAEAITERHTGCTVNVMSTRLKKFLQENDFQVDKETEDDTQYWIISWGEAIIA